MMTKRIAVWLFRIVLALVAITLVGYWWRYGRSEKADFKLPEQANLLINIDLRQMEKTVFWDALSHPLSYWDDSDGDDDDDEHKPSDGITIPNQLAFFLLENHDDVLFSEPIAMKGKSFLEYADTLIHQKKWEAISNHFVYDVENHLFYLWDKNQLGIAFAKRKNADFVQATISDLLKGEHCISMPTDLSEKINLGTHHFVIWRKQSELTNNEPAVLYGDFKKGSMVIQGEVPFQYSFSEQNDYVVNVATSPNEVLSFFLNLNGHNFSFSDSFSRNFQKVTHLELDSLLWYSTGNLSLLVPSIQTKIDSMITYEYDDDFNKIEKVSTQEILVPQIVVHLKSKKDQLLYDYFKRRGVIKDMGGVSRFVGLPFVNMEAVSVGNRLVFSSMHKPDLVQKLDSNFLKLDLACSQYPQMLNYLPFQLDSAQIELIDGVEVRASQVPHTKRIRIEARLKIKNKNRNMLGVLTTL